MVCGIQKWYMRVLIHCEESKALQTVGCFIFRFGQDLLRTEELFAARRALARRHRYASSALCTFSRTRFIGEAALKSCRRPAALPHTIMVCQAGVEIR